MSEHEHPATGTTSHTDVTFTTGEAARLLKMDPGKLSTYSNDKGPHSTFSGCLHLERVGRPGPGRRRHVWRPVDLVVVQMLLDTPAYPSHVRQGLADSIYRAALRRMGLPREVKFADNKRTSVIYVPEWGYLHSTPSEKDEDHGGA